MNGQIQIVVNCLRLTIKTSNLRLAELYYEYRIEGGELKWARRVDDEAFSQYFGKPVKNTTAWGAVSTSISLVTIEGIQCSDCKKTPFCCTPEQGPFSRSMLLEIVFRKWRSLRCRECQAKIDTARREQTAKDEAEQATAEREHSVELAQAREKVEELRATNKFAWQILVRICTDSWFKWEDQRACYLAQRYELSELAAAVGLSEENTYQALKRLADGLVNINCIDDGSQITSQLDAVTGLCLHAESLEQVCKCCRSFYAGVADTVGEVVHEGNR